MEKLREEIKKATEPYEKAVGNFILSLNIQDIPQGKTLKGCMNEIKGKAKKESKNGVAVIEDHKVYGWAAEYFGIMPKEEKPKAQAPVAPQINALDFDMEDLL